MKKIIFGCFALLSASSFAASVDAISSHSAAYLGNPAQNAVMNIESSYYNPAGLTELQDGTYISAGLQGAYVKFGLETKEKGYHGTDPAAMVPDLSFVHKSGKAAYFLNAGGAGGGATLNFKDGVPLIDALARDIITGANGPGGNIKGKNSYAMVNLGLAYELTDQISVTGGIKYIYAQRNIKIHTNDGTYLGGATPTQLKKEFTAAADQKKAALKAKITAGLTSRKMTKTEAAALQAAALKQLATEQAKLDAALKQGAGQPAEGTVDSKRTAQGIGGTIGINYKVTPKWNMSLNYDTIVKLNFKTKTTYEGNLGKNFDAIAANPAARALAPLVNGIKMRRDLPAVLKYGTAYKFTDKFTGMFSTNYYFVSDAKTDGYDGFKDGYEFAFGGEYQLTPRLALTGGYNFAYTGAKSSTFSEVDIPLNSHEFGLGLRFKQNEQLTWTFGTTFVYYAPKTVKGGTPGKHDGRHTSLNGKTPEDIKYTKTVIAAGVGVAYKF